MPTEPPPRLGNQSTPGARFGGASPVQHVREAPGGGRDARSPALGQCVEQAHASVRRAGSQADIISGERQRLPGRRVRRRLLARVSALSARQHASSKTSRLNRM